MIKDSYGYIQFMVLVCCGFLFVVVFCKFYYYCEMLDLQVLKLMPLDIKYLSFIWHWFLIW